VQSRASTCETEIITEARAGAATAMMSAPGTSSPEWLNPCNRALTRFRGTLRVNGGHCDLGPGGGTERRYLNGD
jgi:hypothetical protein